MKRSHLAIFAVVLGLVIANFAISALMWGKLPAQIPTHFGFSGTPDAWDAKNFFTIFLIPLMQLFMFLLFALIYRYPQYSSWPTTLVLMTLEEKKREKVFDVLRSMHVNILLAISIFFSYLQYVIMATANGRSQGVTPMLGFAFIGILFLVIILYSVRMFSTIKPMLKEKN